jgi:hypothetical protein
VHLPAKVNGFSNLFSYKAFEENPTFLGFVCVDLLVVL